MNLPNSITFSRLVLTGVFVAGCTMASTAGAWIALVSFVVAAISDFLDGYLARKMDLVTPMGKLLDPLADKILVGSAYVYLSAEGLCPVWVTVLILAREFLVTGLRQIALEAGQVMAADRLGKWKTALQLTFCITCLLWLAIEPWVSVKWIRLALGPEGIIQPVSLWLSLLLTMWSGWNYLWNCRSLLIGK